MTLPTTETELADHSPKPAVLVNRIDKIDIVRGCALLGILILNIPYFASLMNGLRAIGQTAFTNYIMHTVICTLVLFGYGLNQYAEWEYYQLFYLVIGTWIFQLIISPIWLKYFLFGPLEWCWRSLTYWRIQPFVRKNLN